MTPSYSPRPIDTDDVELPPELTDLLEKLAENTHDNWAAQRLSEGWRYGPERDDDRKEHPGLVPYNMLSKEEQDYDRRTAQETLRLIIKLGFALTPSTRR